MSPSVTDARAVDQVLSDARREEERVLRHQPDVAQHVCEVGVVVTQPVDAHLAGSGTVVPEDEVDDTALARTVRADERRDPLWLELERERPQDRGRTAVSERHVAHAERALDVDARRTRVRALVRSVEQFMDLGQRCLTFDEIRVGAVHRVEWPAQQRETGEEGQHRADRHRAIDRGETAHDQDRRAHHRGDRLVRRTVKGERQRSADARLFDCTRVGRTLVLFGELRGVGACQVLRPQRRDHSGAVVLERSVVVLEPLLQHAIGHSVHDQRQPTDDHGHAREHRATREQQRDHRQTEHRTGHDVSEEDRRCEVDAVGVVHDAIVKLGGRRRVVVIA